MPRSTDGNVPSAVEWCRALVSPELMFTVYAADASDIPVLAQHRAAMFRDMGKIATHLEEMLVRRTASYLREALPRGEYLAWIARGTESPHTIVGGAGAQLRPILPRPHGERDDLELGPEAIVLNVYVAPEWRRRGVGEALMRAVLDGLAVRGISRIVLHASDDGRRLYERLGFIPTNEMRLEERRHHGPD
jgi:ribosomal protein S18 acetylase RimI-like enzyme